MTLGGDGVTLLETDPPPRTLVVSPGLPDDLPLVVAARARGLHVIDEAEVAWRLDTRPWVGVTGTNGKTTSTRLVAAVLEANGVAPVLGGNTYAAYPLSAVGPGGDVVVAELSSFQLERSDTLAPEAGLLTQIGSDHLDRHGTRARYAAAKTRMVLRDDSHALHAAIGIDDGFGPQIARELRERGARALTFGHDSAADVSARPLAWDLERGSIELFVQGDRFVVETLLPGPHNALNVAGAIALAHALGLDLTTSVAAVASTPPPPGRLARLDVECDGNVVFDFAKNAGGVAAALETLRGVAGERDGRVVVILSAVPVADPGGLFAMGAAADPADTVIVTTDRWDANVPLDPPDDLVRGARSTGTPVEVIPDRRDALGRGLALVRQRDILAVLGRSPSPMPYVAADGTVTSFDDEAELRRLATG